MAKGVAVRIQPHVLERLKELGKEHCRTVSQTIEWLVKKYDEENSYEARIKASLEEVSSGRGGMRFNSPEEATKFLNENFYDNTL
ncbi:MAG: hypothetical protein K5780_05775 [Alphaproteobacteria bacterium]|nr:hypothetical protein [Alphaproteobacteria bacterium]